MRPKIILPTLTLSAFGFVLSGTPASAQVTSTPEVSARRFYTWYLGELNREANPIQDNRRLSGYLTTRFHNALKRALAREEGIDADVFIDAQDWDPKWRNNISTSRAVISGRRATLTVTLRGGSPGMGTKRLRLVMRNERSAWRIDSVNGITNP